MKNKKTAQKANYYSFRFWLKKLKKNWTQKNMFQFFWFLAKLVLFYLDHQ
ncbi:hypothetical protein WDW37_08530 [Bdellovibrionota bacterium FG-1]